MTGTPIGGGKFCNPNRPMVKGVRFINQLQESDWIGWPVPVNTNKIDTVMKLFGIMYELHHPWAVGMYAGGASQDHAGGFQLRPQLEGFVHGQIGLSFVIRLIEGQEVFVRVVSVSAGEPANVAFDARRMPPYHRGKMHVRGELGWRMASPCINPTGVQSLNSLQPCPTANSATECDTFLGGMACEPFRQWYGFFLTHLVLSNDRLRKRATNENQGQESSGPSCAE